MGPVIPFLSRYLVDTLWPRPTLTPLSAWLISTEGSSRTHPSSGHLFSTRACWKAAAKCSVPLETLRQTWAEKFGALFFNLNTDDDLCLEARDLQKATCSHNGRPSVLCLPAID